MADSARRPRVLVVSADTLARNYLVFELGGHPVLGDVSAVEPALAPDAFEDADVVLWDTATAEALDDPALARSAPLPVVVLTDAAEGRLPPGLGARSMVRRDASPDLLAAALLAAAEGLWVLDRIFVQDDRPMPGPEQPSVSLTAREQEVLALLAEGLGNKEVAERLGISVHTAKFHIGAILEKLDATSRTEAVVRAARRGLLLL